MASVLVIEDEPDLQKLLRFNLTGAGYSVHVAGTAADGLRQGREAKPDLILLDVMLPDDSGLEVCKTLKRDPATRAIPVIMVTAKGEEIDRVVGFELGADDYVTKPFSVRELLLRVQAILRRGQPEVASGGSFEFGVLKVDRDAHRVFVENREVELTALEFRLLTTLYDRRNRVQSRATLLDNVWGVDSEITTRTVDTHVKRLREKIGRAADYIETVRGVGYRFIETVGGSAR